MGQQVIFHIDVNSAFLSWEAVHRIRDLGETVDLREIDSAVGGDLTKRHGIILAKSVSAKKYRVRTGEPVTEALRKCPHLVLVPPNRPLYQEYSHAFMEILRQYSPTVEQYSIDEAFVDMTGMELLYGDPVEAAHRLKDQIHEELGFTVNVGIAGNKLLAKMASDFEKPDRVHTLFPVEIEEKMWPLPVGDLFFVGRSTEKKLQMLGIKTIGQLAKSDRNLLKSHLKKHGEVIWDFANGIDVSDVTTKPSENKGYGNSTTIPFDVIDAETAKNVLLSLAEKVAARLREHEVKIEVVSVQIRYSDLTRNSHQRVLDRGTNVTDEIYQIACQLFDEFWDGTPIRLLGIQTSRISQEGTYHQMNLFENEENHEKLEKLDQAMDQIRNRFGKDAVKRASFMRDGTEKRK
ncbi:MAG: DNA polymerase IV [Lachnospiraceae bacterium]|nr:DNA polymerase IV [Lachnospiraceae bacterium]